ncbi:ImmA/IrrE family metallo-endopeptidase [Clostridium sediminicola]|uniref:ImmA/IrrE family metallo-endopeptidase n=1 Tax=Clostridium sediminicola TaxID=3114879 RepID=UPI003D176BF3
MREKIIKKVKQLMKKYGTNNPFELADELGMEVFTHPLGNIKGVYKLINRSKVIILNSDLDDYERVFVCAHELGHAIFHPKLNKYFIERYTLYSKDKYENQANLFTAELLLADVNEETCYGLTMDAIAATYNIDKKFVELKFRNGFE